MSCLKVPLLKFSIVEKPFIPHIPFYSPSLSCIACKLFSGRILILVLYVFYILQNEAVDHEWGFKTG